MKNLTLHKFIILVAALAIGSVSVASDALARRSGGAAFTGAGFAGGHMAGFPAVRIGGDAVQSGRSGLRDGHELGRNNTPFSYGDAAHDCDRGQEFRMMMLGEGLCF
jgi:hypothetical protein